MGMLTNMRYLIALLLSLICSVVVARTITVGQSPVVAGADYAVANALVTTADIDGDTGAHAKIAIYNSSGSLIATSSVITWARNTTLSVTITGATLTPGGNYALGIIADANFDLTGADTYGTYENTSGSYSSPPASITFPAGDGDGPRGPFNLWITNAGGQTLIGNSAHGTTAGNVSLAMEMVYNESGYTCVTF